MQGIYIGGGGCVNGYRELRNMMIKIIFFRLDDLRLNQINMNKDMREAYYLSNMFERKFNEEGGGKGQKEVWELKLLY